MNNSELEFQGIYDTFQPRILRYLVRMVGENEAEDLTQEVFVKVGQALKHFRGDSLLSTWIYRIATNAALDKLRSPSLQWITEESLSEDSIGNGIAELDDRDAWTGEKKPLVEQQLVQKEMNDCIRGYIEKLPDNYRTVLVLSEWEGLRNNEIAEILGITLDTVKIRLHRAREQLREALETHCEFYWAEELPCRVI